MVQGYQAAVLDLVNILRRVYILKRPIPHYPCKLAPMLLLVSKHYNLCVIFRPYSMSGTFILGGNNGELTALTTNNT